MIVSLDVCQHWWLAGKQCVKDAETGIGKGIGVNHEISVQKSVKLMNPL